jgi:hypothetical protein
LIIKLETDVFQLEGKLTVLEKLVPAMTNSNADAFMKVLQDILGLPADQSFFTVNINPLRCALIFYKIIDDIQRQKNYSHFISNKMKDQLIEQTAKILNAFQDID